MNIAICDDEFDDLKCIHHFLDSLNLNVEIDEFLCASDLLNAFDSDFYDLIFMDIEMQSPNGYEVSTQLMKRAVKPLIIFTTKSPEYSIRGYGVAFRYLLKPISFEAFNRAVEAAMSALKPQKLSFNINGKQRIFSVDEIFYFEVTNHDIRLHTERATYTFRGSLSEIMTTLAQNHFAQSHKSYFINLAYVDQVSFAQIKLTTGDTVRLSKNMKKAFIGELGKYLKR